MAREYYETFDPKILRPFSLNEPTFGNIADDLDEEFKESIKLYGVLTPPVVTTKKLILSGHRRIAAAMLAGITTISCKVTEETDQQVWREIWAEANRIREMTVEQRGRYYAAIKPIIAASAKRRVMAGVAEDPVVLPRQGTPHDRKTNVIAAEQAGLGPYAAEMIVETIEVIDSAIAEGDEETAKTLRTALETDTPTGAVRKARKVKDARKPQELKVETPPPEAAKPTDATGKTLPKHLIEIFAKVGLWENVLTAIKQVAEEIKVLTAEENEEATHKLNKQQVANDMKNLTQQIKFAIPHAVCPYCKGSGKKDGGGCQCCKGVGWVVRDTYKSAPDDMKG